MIRRLFTACVVLCVGCQGDATMERAIRGQKLVSPSGRYVAVVTQPAVAEPDMLSFRIEDPRGAIHFTASNRWSDRHRLHFVWDAVDRVWSYSSDVGTDVWERQPDGTWTARAWVDTDLRPPAALAPYLQRR